MRFPVLLLHGLLLVLAGVLVWRCLDARRRAGIHRAVRIAAAVLLAAGVAVLAQHLIRGGV